MSTHGGVAGMSLDEDAKIVAMSTFEDREKREELIGEWITEVRDPERFRGRPWQRDVLTVKQLHKQISVALANGGRWESDPERGPTIKIESALPAGYRVTAERGITISGVYDDLQHALAAGALFVSVVWEMNTNGATEGFVWPH
jgi:hypothetical protein